GPRSAVWDAIYNEKGEDAADAFERFKKLVRPLYGTLKEWHQYLTNVWLPDNWKKYAGSYSVKNDTGVAFSVDGISENELARKLAAFRLQGRESAFIHTLTVLGPEFG